MPPRLITGAILTFWLVMTGWLIQREVVPMMLADVSPSFQPDLTDEIGSPIVAWTVLQDGKRLGSANSRVQVNDDRSVEFQSSYQFNQFTMGLVEIQQIEQRYKVSEEGKLLTLSAKFVGKSPAAALLLGRPGFTLDLKAEVVKDELLPRLFLNNDEKTPDIGKITFVQKGNFVNPMHLLNRVRGLSEGKTWTINLPDLQAGVENPFMGDLIKKAGGPSMLIAEVTTDTLAWDHKRIACYKIEYHEPGKEVTVRTWVRKADGLVLQQDTSQFGFDLVLQRIP
jgi:hypothetical protein